MARGTPEGALAEYAGLPTGNPGTSPSTFKAGAGQYLSSPFTFSGAQYYTPAMALPPAAKPGPAPAAPAPAAASGASDAPMRPLPGEPDINAPVDSYEWWRAYNPGADYSRHMGGGGL